MSKKSIFYKHPLLYIWGLKWIHRGNFAKRYRYMASFVEEGDVVLEPACGPAILADFLPKGTHYRGFDTNKSFVNYALRKRAAIHLGNALDKKNYCQADIVVICDILHHLNPADRKTFLENCFSSAKKIFIICEPGKRNTTADSAFYPLKRRLAEWSEKDGTNNFKIEHFLTRDQLLKQISQGFGVIPASVERERQDFGEDIVAVFFKSENSYQKARKQRTISAIVPVFNEEKTVAKVVETLLNNKLINEVICINDGSTDKSLAVLKEFKNKIRLINLEKNKGKGFALAEGIEKAQGEIVTFFDADLTNLSDTHIQALLEPILKGETKAVLGTGNSYLPNIFSRLTGQRAYYRLDLLPHLKKMRKTRFGVEIFLNELFNEESKMILLGNLKGLLKYEKRNAPDALREYLYEAVEIAQEIGKRKGLWPEDYQTITKIAEAANFKELENRVRNLKDKRIKKFFNNYVVKYVKLAKEKVSDFTF